MRQNRISKYEAKFNIPSSWQYTLPASDFVISAKGLCGTRCRSGCPIKSPFALPAAASDAQKRPHREDCKSGEARSSIPGRLAREWRFVAGVNIYSAFLRIDCLLGNRDIGMSENINNRDCLSYLEWFILKRFQPYRASSWLGYKSDLLFPLKIKIFRSCLQILFGWTLGQAS